jgi:hypothetical protein
MHCRLLLCTATMLHASCFNDGQKETSISANKSAARSLFLRNFGLTDLSSSVHNVGLLPVVGQQLAVIVLSVGVENSTNARRMSRQRVHWHQSSNPTKSIALHTHNLYKRIALYTTIPSFIHSFIRSFSSTVSIQSPSALLSRCCS